MINVALSNGTIVDAERITRVTLWSNPTRLQVDIGEDHPPISVYEITAPEDADLLEKVKAQHGLNYPVDRR
jgi:hypothetical protein